MARVRLRGASKTYRRGSAPVFALRDVSLDVADGELLAILGPSGCGKTTLLRAVAGLERLDAGAIYFDDSDVTELPTERRNVGFVFQSPALYPHLSIYDNIAFGPRARHAPSEIVETKVRSSARRMHVDASLLLDRPRELSGGQRQRVALARALANEPAVLLLDEPLSSLDARLRAELRVELSRIHEATGATTLFVTHDQAEALALGHRVAILRDGSIEQIGNARELYDAPLNTFVAHFIGTPPMTLVEGEIADGCFLAPGDLRFRVEHVPAGPAIAGFRPGDVRVSPDGGVRGVVRAVEDLGAEAFAYVDGPYGTLVARHPRRPLPNLGEEVGLELDPGRAHFFDAHGRASAARRTDAPRAADANGQRR